MIVRDILSILIALASVSVPVKENPNKDYLEELIENQGYKVKKYVITTSDGYQLSLHRILNPQKTKNSVLLQHGLLSCGAQWVVNGNKSLAFMLFHAGYDVWISNSRGTSLSKGHVTLSRNDPQYWDFSFHELGLYDVPAAIDFILNNTKRESLHYIGHSQGCTSILTTAILRPEYQKKIISAYLLHPAVFLHNLYPVAREITHDIVDILYERNEPWFILRNTLFSSSSYKICNAPLAGIACYGFFMDLFGGNSQQAENPQIVISKIYVDYVFNDASRKQCEHLVQISDAGKFQMYDYGEEMNKRRYNGSKVPPEYDLSAVSFPVMVTYGTIDGLTTDTDSKILISRLKNVIKTIELPYNHLDPIHSKHVDIWLHQPIIDSLNSYASN
ncbi:lipase 3-like [Culicoides brevitarsis]|uniref:lipase 3-like n=1 Tax=Culicoides brevitarsis TaxID=469753 RepID=UPI00307C1E54